MRFDGVRFTVFDRSNTPQLRSRIITRCTSTPAGRLWIGTARRRADVRSRGVRGTRRAGLRDGYIRAIASGRTAACGSAPSRRCSRVAGDEPAHYGPEQGFDRHCDPRGARSAATARCGWAPMSAGCIAAADGRFEKVAVDGDSRTDGARSSRTKTARSGWAPRTAGCSAVGDGHSSRSPARRIWARQSARSCGDRDDNLWVATTGAGVMRWERRAGLDSTCATARATTFARCCEDPEGSLWIGTFGAGLERLRTGKFLPYGPSEGLPGSLAWSVAPSRDGGCGSPRTPASRATRRQDSSTWRRGSDSTNVRVRAVLEDRSGALWFGTQGRGAFRLQNGRLTRLQHCGRSERRRGESHHAGPYGPHLDRDRTSASIPSSMGRIEPPPAALRDIGPFMTSIVFEDGRKRMWIATDAFGLLHARRRAAASLWRRRRTAEPTASCRCTRTRDGALWFGTLEGLAYYRDGRFVSLAQAAPALRENMLQIVEDAHGSLGSRPIEACRRRAQGPRNACWPPGLGSAAHSAPIDWPTDCAPASSTAAILHAGFRANGRYRCGCRASAASCASIRRASDQQLRAARA